MKMWEPQPLATLRASMACTGIILPIFALREKEFFIKYVVFTYVKEPA
jgi:hypothetical protein